MKRGELHTRLTAWFWGKRVESDAGWWADQVLRAASELRLVLIDPEDREQVRQLVAACRAAFGWTSGPVEGDVDVTQAALRSLASRPRPVEPTGLGAVVEDENRDLWVRYSKYDGCSWMRQNPKPIYVGYTEIAVVKVLSEGVTQ